MKTWAFIFTLSLLAACGVQPKPSVDVGPVVPPPVVVPVEPGQKKAIIALFGAPWCGPCKAAHPQVQAELDRIGKPGVELRLYVTTGATPVSPPTQEIADKYKKVLGLKGTAIPDPRWEKFGKLVGGGRSIPAGAVLDANEKLAGVFKAGTEFNAMDIVALANKIVTP